MRREDDLQANLVENGRDLCSVTIVGITDAAPTKAHAGSFDDPEAVIDGLPYPAALTFLLPPAGPRPRRGPGDRYELRVDGGARSVAIVLAHVAGDRVVATFGT